MSEQGKSSTQVGAGVIGAAVLTHGTMENRKLGDSRAIYEDLLGLRCVQHSPVSQLVAGCGSIGVVCVERGGGAKPQGEENRWIVLVDDEASVRARHATAQNSDLVTELGEIEQDGDTVSFAVQDLDGNWWEVTNRAMSHYQQLFERGDIA